LRLVQYLIKMGAAIDLPGTKFGLTALSIACLHEKWEIAEFLLQSGAAPDIPIRMPGAEGRTALMFTVQEGCGAMVEMLVAGGASLAVRCGHGSSAMDMALQEGHMKCAVLLVVSLTLSQHQHTIYQTHGTTSS
jgi:ankyrin repeat protein